MVRTVIIIIISMVCGVAFAAPSTYYIDYNASDDSANGTSTATPWKRHPYMVGWAGTYTHAAGDKFIFKGGVTWPSATLPLTVAATGTAGNRDTYGALTSWYSGASWTRPTFDGNYDTKSAILDLTGIGGNLNICDLELCHFSCSGNYGPSIIDCGTAVNLLITNCYVHGWRTTALTDDAHGGIFLGWDGDMSTVIDGCEIENSENTNAWNGVCVRLFGVVKNSKIHDNSSAVLYCGDFDHNEIYNICYPFVGFDGAYHDNGVYLQPNLLGGTNGWIRNSYFHDMAGGANMAYPNSISACTIRVYNNVFYGVQGSQGTIEIDPFLDTGTGNCECYNNTIVSYGGLTGIHVVVRAGNPLGSLTAVNNHVIGATTATDADGSTCNSIATNCNFIMASVVATAQGYVLSNRYAPVSSTNSTVNTGTNLSVIFTTDIIGNTRTAPWDIGAYEYIPPVRAAVAGTVHAGTIQRP